MLVSMKYPEFLRAMAQAAEEIKRTWNLDSTDEIEMGLNLPEESWVQPVGGVLTPGKNLMTIYPGPHYSGQ